MDAEARLLKALADPTRLRIAALLARQGEVCVCHLAAALQVPDFRISRHLGTLRAAGLVTARRQGTWMHYRLAPPRSPFERQLVQSLRRGLAAQETAVADRRRLSRAACPPP